MSDVELDSEAPFDRQWRHWQDLEAVKHTECPACGSVRGTLCIVIYPLGEAGLISPACHIDRTDAARILIKIESIIDKETHHGGTNRCTT